LGDASEPPNWAHWSWRAECCEDAPLALVREPSVEIESTDMTLVELAVLNSVRNMDGGSVVGLALGRKAGSEPEPVRGRERGKGGSVCCRAKTDCSDLERPKEGGGRGRLGGDDVVGDAAVISKDGAGSSDIVFIRRSLGEPSEHCRRIDGVVSASGNGASVDVVGHGDGGVARGWISGGGR